MLDDTPNQPSKFKTKNWVEVNNKSHGVYKTGCKIKFKTSMLMSSSCDHTEAYIFIKGTITVSDTGTGTTPNNGNKKVIFKNCAPFSKCISEINNTEIDLAKEIDVLLSMYNLIEYSDNYWKFYGIIIEK